MITVAERLRPQASAAARGAQEGHRGTTGRQVEVLAALRVLKVLAARIRFLEAEATTHEKAILALVRSWRPDLLALRGVGPIVAATVLTAWSHPGRCRDDAAFAMLAGAAPIPASSGKTIRHRLNRSGDRQLNRALHTIALSRLQYEPKTAPTPTAAEPRARPTTKSNAASSATSPDSSTANSKHHHLLDEP
jgi:transposase